MWLCFYKKPFQSYSKQLFKAVSDEVWRLIVLVYCLSSRCTSNMLKASFDRVLVGQVVLVKASGTVPRDDIMTRDMLLLAGLICSRGAGEQGHRVRWFKITESISNIRNMQGGKKLLSKSLFSWSKKVEVMKLLILKLLHVASLEESWHVNWSRIMKFQWPARTWFLLLTPCPSCSSHSLCKFQKLIGRFRFSCTAPVEVFRYPHELTRPLLWIISEWRADDMWAEKANE